jgi:hypothetical protein
VDVHRQKLGITAHTHTHVFETQLIECNNNSNNKKKKKKNNKQKGCIKNSQGYKEQLIIDSVVLEQAHTDN